MMQRAVIAALLIGAFGLAACGFHPVYGSKSKDGAPIAEQMNQVAIDPIPERQGQLLRNDLIDRFYNKGRPSQPLYHLTVSISVSDEDLGLLTNATTSLAAVHTTGNYTLKDNKDKVILTGVARSTGTYDKLNSQYSTLAAHDSAVERTVQEVSEQITSRLSLYFAEGSNAPIDVPTVKPSPFQSNYNATATQPSTPSH